MLGHSWNDMAANNFNSSAREASVRAKTAESARLYNRAQQSLAGGVSTSLRRSARPYPLYFSSGKGAAIHDVDGNSYVDYAMAWGPLILGHAPPAVERAIVAQASRGLTYGAQHNLEYEVAERLTSIIPCADQVCFANSGTEIVQVALRLARAATGRRKFLKFEGHYHGWDDSVLLSYRPSAEQIAAANGAPVGVGLGQLPSTQAVIVEWNNRQSVEAAFAANPGEISAIICEPLACNCSCLPPLDGFLEFLREITNRHGALLIFDEVITGFRLAPGGAQEHYGITPDLATYAKAIGAGTPLSALAGKREFMDLIASGKVVHAGTLNGNPISLAAAKAALDELTKDGGNIYREMHRRGDTLRAGLQTMLQAAGLPVVTNGVGPVFHLSFAASPPRNYRDTMKADAALYSDFALALLDEGVMVLPDGRWYLSTAHTDDDVAATLAAARRILEQ
ncbi:MAG: aspartate aminotransferase family protein [Acidobacteria bacterium]|nr:aspartate aminotransferase family protein [Acidobacteriota bacterium]